MSSTPNADDRVISAQCDATEIYVVPHATVEESIDDIMRHLAFDQGEEASQAALDLHTKLLKLREEVPFPCDWDGEIDAHTEDGITWTWTCPRCGTDHTTEV